MELPKGGLIGKAIAHIRRIQKMDIPGHAANAGYFIVVSVFPALVLILGVFTRRSVRPLRLAIGLVLGTLAMAAVMVPMNLTLTVYFLGTPRAAVVQMLLPAILPFNLLKAGINSALTAAVYAALRPLLRRQRSILGVEKEI